MRLAAAIALFLLAAAAPKPGLSAQGSAAAGGKNLLVLYFSWAENTREYAMGGVDAVSSATTNTLMLAKRIHDRTGGDLVGIQTATPYTADYNAALEQALKEQGRQARPPLKTRVAGIGKYDVILLGYPNWWASIPMPVATFLETHDLSGKLIIPFCSHGGGRLGQSVSAIAKLAPKSRIAEGLSISYGGGASLDRDIGRWLQSVGVATK